MKIAILGQPDTIVGFSALGLHLFPVNNKEQAIQALEQIQTRKNLGILFITENWYEQIDKEINETFKDSALPAILAIPSAKGPTGQGLKNVKKIVEKAIGSDILS